MPTENPTQYAIVNVAGKQFRVEAGQELKVPHTDGEVGANLSLGQVLFYQDGSTPHFGQPLVPGATVDATILGHGRDPKITVFKFRRRKGYRKKVGHRQGFSILRINGISMSKSKPAAEAKGVGRVAPKSPGIKPAAGKSSPKAAAAKSGTARKAAPKVRSAKTGTGKPAAGAKTTSAAKKTAAKNAAPVKKSPAAKKTGSGTEAAGGRKKAGGSQGKS